MAQYDKADIERRMTGAVEALKSDLSGLRTGRANVSLLDPVMCEVYGAMMPLNQVATVSAPEPRMLSVQVWDKSNLTAVEKGIAHANLGLNPMIDGQTLRLPMPDLTEERRKDLAKLAEAGAIRPVIAARFPLDAIAEAHLHLETSAPRGEIVIEVTPVTELDAVA